MPIFISYSHNDRDFVDKLATHLIKNNAHIWVDRWEIKVGESMIERVQNELQGASAILVILSKSSVQSEWCKKELSAGLIRELSEKAILVLPVLIEQCDVPIFLREKKYADFTSDFAFGLDDLLRSIAHITSIDQSRIIEPNGHVDWAVDWKIVKRNTLVLSFLIYEYNASLPFTVATKITVKCNQAATERYMKFERSDLGWLGRMVIVQLIHEVSSQEDIKILLTDAKEKSVTFAAQSKGPERYDIEVGTRWLGQSTGNDLVVNVGNHMKRLRDYMESTTRQLTHEEQRKAFALLVPI